MTNDNGDQGKILHMFVAKPGTEAALQGSATMIADAGAFLSRICPPASEEFGLLLRDRASHWRVCNVARIATNAQAQLSGRDRSALKAHPRLVAEVIDKGSWNDDDQLQEMWAGLLASSCTSAEPDDGNLVFAALLGQLTAPQVKVLAHACEAAHKYLADTGLPMADDLQISAEELMAFTGVHDVHRLDRELDHLRNLQLIESAFGGGLDFDSRQAHVSPTALCLNLYVRGKGFAGSPSEYWDLRPKTPTEDES